MLRKLITKYKTGNKKDRHWILFSMLVFSWLLGMIGLVLVKYEFIGIGRLLAITGIAFGSIFLFMGLMNILTGPNEKSN